MKTSVNFNGSHEVSSKTQISVSIHSINPSQVFKTGTVFFKTVPDIAVSLNWINLFEDFSPEYIGFHELDFEYNGVYFSDAYFHTKSLIQSKYNIFFGGNRMYYTTWWNTTQVCFLSLLYNYSYNALQHVLFP